MLEPETYECTDDQPGTYHIRGVHNMQITLCGFVDVIYETHDYSKHPCNCTACIDALKSIKALKFPKGYFKA